MEDGKEEEGGGDPRIPRISANFGGIDNRRPAARRPPVFSSPALLRSVRSLAANQPETDGVKSGDDANESRRKRFRIKGLN